MTDIRRFPLAAVVLLVVLRLALGWQLLYEGLWKINTLNTPSPWTSAGYLKNSTGPLRDTFREMAGDPDDLDWLDYEKVSARWIDWGNRFHRHFRLDEKQTGQLYALLHGSTSKVGDQTVFSEPLAALPTGIEDLNKASKVSSKAVWYDAKQKRLNINADVLLEPTEKAKLEALVSGRNDAEAAAFLTAVNRVYDRQKNGLGYLRKLLGALKGDPALAGNADAQRLGKFNQYRQELAQYEADYAKAKTAFQWDHLNYTWGKLQALRSELTGPIKAMEAEMKEKADKLLTVDQLGRGPVPQPWSSLKMTDTLTIIGLTGLGILLILGLFTRFACVAAAFMLFNFYMAMPPLPGYPEAAGPEHSFVINKNLIEVFALLALAAVPTGLWFGVDRLLQAFFANWKQDSRLSSHRKSMVAVGDEPTEAPDGAALAT